jgi:hypothetical protein
MIKSDAQCDRTLDQIRAFKVSVEAEQNNLSKPEQIRKLVVDSLNGMIAKLEFEVKEYQELKTGIIRLPPCFVSKTSAPTC